MLNDFSGSPNILALVIKGLIKKGYQVELYSSSFSTGFLSNIDGVKYHEVFYKFSTNKLLTSILFVYAQVRYFLAVIKYRKKENTKIYINTILPFGAALGAALIKKKVIYHVHEKPVTKNLIQNIGVSIFTKFSNKSIFVSKYLLDSFDLPIDKKVLVYNSLAPEFSLTAKENKVKRTMNYNVLMVCSLRTFKGVLIFLALANRLPEYSFTLVLNADGKEITSFFNSSEIPHNLEIFETQINLHSFYKKANLLVNLSIPDVCVETFGLTALEAMIYGIPVIIPPVGGIAEIVDEGVQGFKIDSRDINQLVNKVILIFSDKLLYQKMAEEAKKKSNAFSYTTMIDEIEKVINL